jgi:hypothetical protein
MLQDEGAVKYSNTLECGLPLCHALYFLEVYGSFEKVSSPSFFWVSSSLKKEAAEVPQDYVTLHPS